MFSLKKYLNERSMFEKKIETLNPVHFFAISLDCQYLGADLFPYSKKYLLPLTDKLTGEYSFANISIGWQEKGIGLNILVKESAVHSRFPDIDQGDSVELFFDTRDLKTAGFNTRFCHHFFFLPQSVEGTSCGEKTHFRTEDSHPLCDASLLICETVLKKNEYQIKIFIPSECLYGYDVNQFDRLGFTYRINRAHGNSQHFSVMTQDYQIDQQPSLWASLNLRR